MHHRAAPAAPPQCPCIRTQCISGASTHVPPVSHSGVVAPRNIKHGSDLWRYLDSRLAWCSLADNTLLPWGSVSSHLARPSAVAWSAMFLRKRPDPTTPLSPPGRTDFVPDHCCRKAEVGEQAVSMVAIILISSKVEHH